MMKYLFTNLPGNDNLKWNDPTGGPDINDNTDYVKDGKGFIRKFDQ